MNQELTVLITLCFVSEFAFASSLHAGFVCPLFSSSNKGKSYMHVNPSLKVCGRTSYNNLASRMHMSYDRTSHEVADQARILYSGSDEDLQAQTSWNKLQMDFVLVRSFMKLDNRFQHSAARTKSLLSAVVEMGRTDLVAALLRMGAAVDDRDFAGRTALMVACSSEDEGDWDQMVETLLKAGADIQARDSNGDTALHLAQRSD